MVNISRLVIFEESRTPIKKFHPLLTFPSIHGIYYSVAICQKGGGELEDTDARALIVEKRRNVKWIVLVLEMADQIKLPDRTFLKPSKWGFPGGRSDSGDVDAVYTAIREVQEEVRMDVLIDERCSVRRKADGHTKVLFLGYADGQEPRPNHNEIMDARWFPIDVLYDANFNMYSRQREMAQELLQKLRR